MATREQLKHAIRASCEITRRSGVIIIGSQSLLATWPEDEQPYDTRMSDEIDVWPLGDDDRQSLATALAGAAGELSHFHATHDFYIDGVGRSTPTLPDGFEGRLIPVQDEETKGYVGYCLDPVDLCVAKLVANRDKDRVFVSALIEHRMVDPREIDERLWMTDLPEAAVEYTHSFLAKEVERWNLLGIEAVEANDTLRRDTAPTLREQELSLRPPSDQ